MTVAAAAPPHLTEAEINEICKPLTQHHAQMRHLCLLLDVDSLPRRPDGLPLVGRKLYEERINKTGTYTAPAGFKWSR
ncbi:MAG: hypothetical protein ACN6O3_12480 [Comamonas sp.]